ncbi:sigma-54-dependent transcriptional regulator [Thermodesulfobacteriota bacterium]
MSGPVIDTSEVKILLVEDEEYLAESIKRTLKSFGYDIRIASHPGDGMRMMLELDPDLIILDLALPPSFHIREGLEFFQRVLEGRRNTKIIILTGQGTDNEAIRCIRQGADDFLFKPVKPEVLAIVIERALYKGFLEKRVRELEAEFDGQGSFPDLIGESKEMRRIFRGIRYAADMGENVLIAGETGTGKGLVAQAIHDSSSRRRDRFVTVNCAALAPGLVESELFGHEKGAFTGAHEQKTGKFEYAGAGTIFLDEVAEIPVRVQVKLLTVVEEKMVQRVGGNRSVKVGARIISATNRNPGEAIRDGRFREDLYYRLNVLPITIPPLRERRDDIAVLARYFVRKFCEKYSRKTLPFHPDAIARLKDHHWPGNVRELENVITRAMVGRAEGELTAEDLPIEPDGDSTQAGGEEPPVSSGLEEKIDREVAMDYVKALREARGNKSLAAKRLKIHESTFRYRLKKYEKIIDRMKGWPPDEDEQ